MERYTRRNILKSLGAVMAFSTSSNFVTLAFADARETTKETRTLMDTFVTIEVRDSSQERRSKAIKEAFHAIEHSALLFNRYEGTSPLALLNAKGGISNAPRDFLELMRIAQQYAYMSNHLFNPTVQPLVDYFLHTKTVDRKMMKEVRSYVRTMEAVHITSSSVKLAHENMGITLDGIAKGYIVDTASRVLERNGITHYMVNAGGDIVVKGQQQAGLAWNIGIQSPVERNAYIDTIALTKGAIATSGGYERYNPHQERYTHLVNPYTGQSPHRIRSVSVLAPTAVQADALATTLSVMQPKHAMQYIARYPNCACSIIMDTTMIRSPLWNRLKA